VIAASAIPEAAAPDPDELDDLIARLLELNGFAPRYREPEVLGHFSRPCRCDRPWEFEHRHCARCGHDVALELIGDELRPYLVDDPARCAFPNDGRLAPGG
jgi:hypothetical protein